MQELDKTVKKLFIDSYIVPLYQRNFAWGEEQITQLLQDIYESYLRNKENRQGNYYIGTLVALQRRDSLYEVIDGQQRLTVLTLLCKLFGIITEPKLSYDSRPEVEKFLNDFFDDSISGLNSNYKTSHFVEAIEDIKNVNIKVSIDNKDKIVTYDDLLKDQNFIDYFSNNVIIIRVEIPEYTDVAAYFEIMNNRGEQLKKHEILKALMISSIKDENDSDNEQKQRAIFAKIWDACSEMDIPIQRSFNKADRITLFGDNYDDILDCCKLDCQIDDQSLGYSLEDIIIKPEVTGPLDKSNTTEDDYDYEQEVASIIDFPNFLMHVFKIYVGEPVKLNEKYLLDEYENIKEKIAEKAPLDFANALLKMRVLFDRYVVKVFSNNNEKDETKWGLIKPENYGKSWKYIGIYKKEFNKETENIIKALSMLQVTFRQRIYKNYLNEILAWLYKKDKIYVDAKEYLAFLNSIILNYFDVNFTDDLIDKNNQKDYQSDWASIPHFLFNFIDYLYWVAKEKKIDGIPYIDSVKDFDFTYRNSIEHHLPQSFENNKEKYSRAVIDNIGNLCLVSKNINSKMNNEDPKGKASETGKYYKENLTPKRKIMYDITNARHEWDETEINEHRKDVLNLIKRRKEILSCE